MPLLSLSDLHGFNLTRHFPRQELKGGIDIARRQNKGLLLLL